MKSFISIDSLEPLSSEKGELVSKMEASFRSYMELNDQVTPIKHPYEKLLKSELMLRIFLKRTQLCCPLGIFMRKTVTLLEHR